MSWARPTIQYCETSLAGLIKQPVNAFSSLFISLAGLYVVARKAHKYSLPLGAIAIVLGLCSFTYYATNTYAGQLSDLAGMIAIALLMLAIAKRLARAAFFVAAGLIILLLIIALARTIGGLNTGIPIFAALIGLSIYFEARAKRNSYRYYWLAFWMMALAFLFWVLDYKKVWCDPRTLHYINGHGVWHFFNGFAIVMLDRHYEANKENL